MKKIIALLLLSALLFSLCSCNTNKSDDLSDNLEDTEVNKNDISDKPNDNKIDMLSKLLKDFNKSATIEETVLFSEKQIEIIANSISFTEDAVNLEISIKNNSNIDLNFSGGSYACDVNSVNKIMASDGFINCDVIAGTSTNEEISFDIRSLIANGISSVASIDIGFWVSGEDYDNFYTGPLSLNTSLNDSYDYSVNTYHEYMSNGTFENILNCEIKYYSNKELYVSEDGAVRILSAAVVENKDGDVIAMFEIENTSSQKIQAWGKETHINGELMQSYSSWIESINSGNKLIATFSLSDYANEYDGEADVSVLKEFTFTLSAGENSNIANSSGQIRIDIEDSKIVLIKE